MATSALPRRGYVGLHVGTSPVATGGLSIRAVAPQSSAADAGVRAGDVLTHLDENPAVDVLEVRHLLRALRPGDPLLLDVLRNGNSVRFETTVAAFPLERHEGARVDLGQVGVGSYLLRSIAVIPESRGPHPCVYLLPGAHWASEEYPLDLGHPVPTLVGELAKAGFATVRVERSGIGDSQGPPCTRVDFVGELEGFRAGLRGVFEEDWVDRRHVFAFGHSLGAMIAPLLATTEPLSGIACYAPSAIPISVALVGAILRHAETVSSTVPDFPAERIAELIRLVVTGGADPEAVFQERPDLAAIAPSHFTGDQAYGRVARFYHQLERADIEGAWRKFRGHALFISGGRDRICTSEDARALALLRGAPGEAVDLPGVDHQMNDRTNGKERLAPALRDALVEWFRARHRGGSES